MSGVDFDALRNMDAFVKRISQNAYFNAMQDKEAENEPAADRADDVKPVEA